MKPRPPDDCEPGTPSGKMREALNHQLGESQCPAPTPPPIPDHTLLHRIGRGAYGDVWLARNALGTLRAVKVVYRANFEDDRPYEREFNGILKFEPVSRTHEGLVQVLHVGRSDATGCFYYVMEVADAVRETSAPETRTPVAGATAPGPRGDPAPAPRISELYRPRTLRSELARGQRLPPVEAAQLTLRMARALAHLHRHGLVHRDVKPSNVIFVGGQPKLADIGLVTNVGSSHSFVGTEGFVPPEGPGTPQADLFALGKVLYELATGRDRMEFPLLPPRVSQLRDGELLLELNEVLTRACAPDLNQRYATVTELEADLHLFLAGRSLRRARNIERHLARLKKIADVACLFLILTAGALWLVKAEERRATERAKTEATLRQRAEVAERETAQQLYSARLEQARAMVRSGEMGHRTRALDALRQAAAFSNAVELRREMFAALALPDMRPTRQLPLTLDISAAEFDSDFVRIAVCSGQGPAQIRTATDYRLLLELPARTNLIARHFTWSRDGRFLAVHRQAKNPDLQDVELWDLATTNCLQHFHQLSPGTAAFHPVKPQFMAGDENGILAVGNLTVGARVESTPTGGPVADLLFSPSGNLLTSVVETTNGFELRVQELTNQTLVASHRLAYRPGDIAWHPSDRWISLPDVGGLVQLLDLHTGELRVLGRHKAEVATSVFSPDGGYLITGSWDGGLAVWDLRAMRRAFTIPQNTFQLQFRRDGRECVFLDRDSWGLQFCAFELPVNHREFPEDLGVLVRHATFSPDGRLLTAAGRDRLAVWNLEETGPAATVDLPSARPAFSPDSTELFACNDNEGRRWRLEKKSDGTLHMDQLPLPPLSGYLSFCTASNGVMVTSAQGTHQFVTEQQSNRSTSWLPTAVGVNGISPNGRWLGIYASFSDVLHVYRMPDLQPVAKLSRSEPIAGFAFSPSEDELAVFAWNGVRLWDTTTWQPTKTLTNFSLLMYDRKGIGVWLDRGYRQAGLYDARSLELILPLPRGMTPLALSPDGRQLAVSIDLQRVQLWDIGEVRAELRRLGMDWPGE